MRANHNGIKPFGAATWQRGLTLVELMVAVTIGLIITAAVAQVYISSRTSYTLEEGMARVQESGRFAVEFLAYDLRMAGYFGCNSKSSTTTTNNVDDDGDNVADAAYTMTPGGISAHRYTGSGTAATDWSPSLPAGFFAGGEVTAGTDVIIVKYGSTEDATITDNMGAENANIQLTGTDLERLDIAADDILMVSDCQAADIFRATNVSNAGTKKTIAHAAVGNVGVNLSKPYGMDAQLMKMISRAYYIGTGTGGQPALFRVQLGRDPDNPSREELIQGIEDMRFLFAEDTDGNRVPDVYRAANSVANWSNVYGVRMGVLVRTPDTTAGSDGSTYEVAGVPLTKTDNYRRHAFNTLVQLRN